MTKYLLLRDNKESGPFDLDDLKTKGLKAYDLVWVEGKSAAWRYPCEIEELSAYAPAVEEQPFDRFFKKPSQTTVSSTAITGGASAAAPVVTYSAPAATHTPPVATPVAEPVSVPSAYIQSISAANSERTALPGKRSIYVTMPAGRPISSPINETSGQKDNSSVNNAPVAVFPTGYKMPVEDVFTQTKEDWSDVVELSPRSGKSRSRIWQPVAAIGSVLALLAAGIFIGLSINGDRSGFMQKLTFKDETTSSATPIQVAQQRPAGPLISQTVPGTSGETAGATTAAPGTVGTSSVQSAGALQSAQSAVTGTTGTTAAHTGTPSPSTTQHNISLSGAGNGLNTTSSKKQSAGKDKNTGTEQKPQLQSNPEKDSSVNALMATQHAATHHTDPGADKENPKENNKPNIASQVSVGANGYTVGTFGGISDLQLTVSNHSNYSLDLVVVEVQYIQANKKVYKTENLNFHDIGAGSALMLEAPKTSRGIKVQYRITQINSKEPGLSYSAI